MQSHANTAAEDTCSQIVGDYVLTLVAHIHHVAHIFSDGMTINKAWMVQLSTGLCPR